MRAFEFITEGNDREFHTGGSLGLPFPGTYEQEYTKFKKKGPRRITAMTNEALDSSYEYRMGKNPGSFYFDTEDGQEYKVDIGKGGGVSFYARGQGDEHKIGITGKGDSRRIFGTVIKIVKDYVDQNNPKEIWFTASNSEPTRVKLYGAFVNRAAQVLANYQPLRPLNTGDATEFVLQRKDLSKASKATKNVKRFGQKALDTVFEETTTLTHIYQNEKPDDNEQIWDYGTMIWDQPLEVKKITARELDFNLCHQYDVEGIEDLFDKMEPEQHDIVNNYINDPKLSNYIIVLDNGHIVDGNHRAIAAALTGKSLRYVDIGEEE